MGLLSGATPTTVGEQATRALAEGRHVLVVRVHTPRAHHSHNRVELEMSDVIESVERPGWYFTEAVPDTGSILLLFRRRQ